MNQLVIPAFYSHGVWIYYNDRLQKKDAKVWLDEHTTPGDFKILIPYNCIFCPDFLKDLYVKACLTSITQEKMNKIIKSKL